MNLEKSEKVKLVVLLILFLAMFAALPVLFQLFDRLKGFLENSGFFSPFIFVAAMAAAIVISPIPASPLAIFGGSVYGPWLGMLLTLIGATLGAMLAFLIARFFLGKSLGAWIARQEFYNKISGKKNSNILGAIFLTRLMPQISFDIVSYAAGLTKISIWSFAAVTFVGMMPIVFILSFFGYVIEPYVYSFLGFLLLIFVLYILYRLAVSRKGNDKNINTEHSRSR